MTDCDKHQFIHIDGDTLIHVNLLSLFIKKTVKINYYFIAKCTLTPLLFQFIGNIAGKNITRLVIYNFSVKNNVPSCNKV